MVPSRNGPRGAEVASLGLAILLYVVTPTQIGDQEIVGVEIPTGQPLVYELNDDLSVSDRYYLSERPA